MKKIILSLFFLCLLVGCKHTKSIFPSEFELKGKMLSVGDSLGIPFFINTLDDYVVVRDDNDGTCFTLVKSDLSFCYHFGVRGEGPNELIDPGPLFINGSTFSVYDGAKLSLFTYSLDSLLQQVDRPTLNFKTDLDGNIISLIGFSDSIYIATGAFRNDKRFSILNSKGELLSEEGLYNLKDEEKSLPFYIKGVAFQSVMTRKPDDNRFALATRYGGVLEIYDFNPYNLSLIQIQGGANFFAPRLTVENIQGSLNFVPDDNTRWGYLFLASDSQYIYALYSGLYQREGEPFISGNTVHVFDWNGFPISQLKLDKRVRDIAVKGNKLYGLYEDKDIGYELIEYTLPTKLN